MPSPWPWPMPPLQRWLLPHTRTASYAGPQIQDKRPCGCIADPVVFGHDRYTCTIPLACAA